MRVATVAILLFGAMAVATPAIAQTASPAPPVTRTVLATTKLRTTGNVSIYFGAVGVVIPVRQSSDLSAVADGILYQMSGSTEVTIGRAAKTLTAHEGLFIAAGTQASLKAGSDLPSTLMHFLVGRAPDLDRSGATAPATVIEIFRTTEPIPSLKAGVHDLDLTLVTFPPHTASNAPHYRSGAALYYVLSGTGTNTVKGETVAKGVGSVIYEPSGLVHRWGNPGGEPLRFVAFNINPEGIPAVVLGRAR